MPLIKIIFSPQKGGGLLEPMIEKSSIITRLNL